jgi:hypothetical protein
VALLGEKVRDAVNREVIFCAAALSAAMLTYSLRRDDSDFVVFCFAKSEDAAVFAERFGGRGCLRPGDNPENKRGDPSALFRTNRVQIVSSCRGTGPIDGLRSSVRFGLKVTPNGHPSLDSKDDRARARYRQSSMTLIRVVE